ncbi:MAG: phenylalanine--tRNA ligase subunit beta [Oscillospiraceae bacterium]|jgi:phenylalanyl-tRNA synthetase beta chain|nr:phenylalanine--tRNA ligase subunit beta [Oscillospiraceae bacterium]
MLVSMNWVRDFVNLDGLDLEALIHRFTLSTAEVEEVIHKGAQTRGILVAKILTVEKHPDSKKLHLLTVDKGSEVVDVVCGAPNVRPGMHVAFAPAGAVVSGMELTRAKIAGYISNGMCCSEKELGMSDDHEGIADLDELGLEYELGAPVERYIELYDTIFEVDNKSLTNRPDLWGIYGVAREFAALTGRALGPVPQTDLNQYEALPPVDISVESPACQRYCGLKVENVSVRKAPLPIRARLHACGMRGINLLADLTNYLMLELGQPMHAFDLRRVSDICVKTFNAPFVFQTLDGSDREIDANTLMICNGSGKAVAVAGIMGGFDSEIKDDTSALLLESATFDPVSIRKSSSRLGLRTDASARYEKALDPELTIPAVGRFLHLLLQCDGGVKVISRLSMAETFRYPAISIALKQSYLDRYTGMPIARERVTAILRSLGFGVEEQDWGYQVGVPGWRATKDVTMAADLVEEITRVYGYDNFEISSTRSLLAPVRPRQGKTDETLIRDMLVLRRSLHEVHSYIWADKAKFRELELEIEPNVRLLNSVNPNHETLRRSMIPTLLTFINENRGYAPKFGIFEIGRTVRGLKDNGECDERRMLGIAVYGREITEEALFFRLRDMVDELLRALRHAIPVYPKAEPEHSWQHPMNTFRIELEGQSIGQIAPLHPRQGQKIDKKAAIAVAELDLGLLEAIAPLPLRYREPSKFPGIDADLSFVLGAQQAFADIERAANALDCEWLESIKLTDVFALEDGASVTVRLAFASNSKTLARAQVEPYIEQLVQTLAEKGIPLKQ